jgi:hypothetical protein
MTIVFSVENSHTEESGAPPPWTTAPRDASELRAYFENAFGEQWIASATPRRFLLTGGDVAWKTTRIDDPDYRSLATRCVDPTTTGFEGTILRHEERFWLLAVLTAAVEGCRRQ